MTSALPMPIAGTDLILEGAYPDGYMGIRLEFKNTNPVFDSPYPSHSFLVRFRTEIIDTLKEAEKKYFPHLKEAGVYFIYAYLNSDGNLYFKYITEPDDFNVKPIDDDDGPSNLGT